MSVFHACKLITWLDVERLIKNRTKNKTDMPSFIKNIFHYHDCMEVEYHCEVNDVLTWLGSLFGRSFVSDTGCYIKLDIGGRKYYVSLNYTDANDNDSVDINYPLWKEQVYSPVNKVGYPDLWSGGPKVVAFHSFKGGVGRTTSLMTYATAVLNSKDKAKILLVDADMEAPGISFWLDNETPPTVSFLSFIEALHYSNEKEEDETIDYFCNELKKTSINVGGANKEIFILPAALDVSAVMDMPVTPEHISKNLSNPLVLSDSLKFLGERLGVDVVFIDLRAGMSELASPVLFDPRIEHFFVTTVAPQSVKGMSEILKRVHSSHEFLPDSLREIAKPSVIISLLTNQLRQLPVYTQATECLNNAYPAHESDMLTSGIELLEADFNQSLMSINSVRHALEQLSSSSLYDVAVSWANSYNNSLVPDFLSESKGGNAGDTSNALELYNTCYKFQFAENANTNDMLVTDPLRNLAKNYTEELPNIVSIGAKGAGKTFTYLQVCMTRTWSAFLKKINNNISVSADAIIYPWLCSVNINDVMSKEIRNARKDCMDSLAIDGQQGLNLSASGIKNALGEPKTDWDNFWTELLLSEFGGEFSSLAVLNEWLVKENKSIVLLIDGIEDLFDSPENDESQRNAIRALLHFPNILADLNDRKIGFICFIRADYVQAVIKQNVAQYVSRFQQFRLEWTPESFLRLAYWICGKAGLIGANADEAETHNLDYLLSKLELLWGKKLGRDTSKEAHTARWVFAALCDLNGRLQARDLVRFLKFSADIMIKAQSHGIKVDLWPDRVLAPEAIRKSLPACSDEKVSEAANEIKILNLWKESLDSIPQEYKKVPFNPIEVGLNLELLNSLRELGVIYEDVDQLSEDRYFLPEIYRWGLKFVSAGGGRPRVQALLKRNLGGMPF